MNTDLHLAKVQQRWHYADDELAAGEGLDMEQLAYDIDQLPALHDGQAEEVAESVLDFIVGPKPGDSAAGGAIEPLPDDDGVLITKPNGIERADIT